VPVVPADTARASQLRLHIQLGENPCLTLLRRGGQPPLPAGHKLRLTRQSPKETHARASSARTGATLAALFPAASPRQRREQKVAGSLVKPLDKPRTHRNIPTLLCHDKPRQCLHQRRCTAGSGRRPAFRRTSASSLPARAAAVGTARVEGRLRPGRGHGERGA